MREPVSEHGDYRARLHASGRLREHREHDPPQRLPICSRRPPFLAAPRRNPNVTHRPSGVAQIGERRPGWRISRTRQPPSSSPGLPIGNNLEPLVLSHKALKSATQRAPVGLTDLIDEPVPHRVRSSALKLSSSVARVNSIVVTPGPRSTRKSPTKSHAASSSRVTVCRPGNRRSSWRTSTNSRL